MTGRKSALTLPTLLGLTLLLGGCYIAAIHPLAEQDQRIYDPSLIGTWTSGHDTLRFTGDNIDNLKFEVSEGAGSAQDSARSGGLDILLTQIDDRKFMDVQPADFLKARMPTLEAMLLIPMHAFIWYDVKGDTLSVQSLNYTEFNSRMKKGKWKGLALEPMQEGGPLLITSPTSRIRKFLHSRQDEGLYANPVYYTRVKS